MFRNSKTGKVESGIAQVVASLKSTLQQGPSFVSAGVVAKTISTESFDEGSSLYAEAADASSRVKSAISQANKEAQFAGLSLAQEDAGVQAAFYAQDPRGYLSKSVNRGDLSAFGSDNTFVINTGASSVDKRSISAEQFDDQANRNAAVYSVAYNTQAARQNDFAETFFPVVVQAPDQVGYMVSVKLIEVIDTQRRDISGALQNFNRKNIIKAEIDSTILQNDITRLYPILRDVSEDKLLKDYPKTVELSGEEITTAPYAIGKKFSILGISQSDVALAAGIQDESDAVDSGAKLAAIYVELEPGKVVKFSTKNTPTSAFNFSVQGPVRQLQLAFTTNTLTLTKDTKLVDGSALPADLISALADGAARMSVGVYGSINQQQGDTQLSANDLSVEKLVSADGDVLSLTGPEGVALTDALASAKVIGYDLDAYRTNSNRRNRGQLVDTREINYLYSIPVLPPITAIRPVANSEANDAAMLQSLVQTTRTRANNLAVTKLLDTREYLKEYTSSAIMLTDDVEMLGAAAKLVTPVYDEVILDAATATDSLRSAQRAEDVVGLIVNQIRDIAYRMYQASGYQAAADVQAGGIAEKPAVLIGTDPTIARYLTLLGDTRTLGDQFDFKIVSTLDSRMKGQIAISFGKTTNDGTPNPLHFGNLAWRTELTLMMPMVRNGANVMEMTVQPQFEHIANLPVLGWIELSGISEIIASKATVKTAVIPVKP